MKGQWFSVYFEWIYVFFRSVLAGCHCILFGDVTLIKLHTMNSYLTWFYLSQTSYHIHFVSNYPSYSLCLKSYVIFTLSQIILHILLSQTICHIYFVSYYPSYSLCLRPTVIFTLSQINRLGLRLQLGYGLGG